MSDIEDEPPPVLLPCTICSRTFRPEVLERHVKVCEKSASKKRRVFDSFKNRVSGTELEEFLGPAPLPGQILKRPSKSPVKKRGPPKWKETHENLIAVLRAARGVNPPTDGIVEAPKPAGNEQCPSCFRFFGPRAFDRHVEFCKEKTARIKMTPSKVSQAQERLEARTKYRAPLSIKPKLTTKEKYSPMPTRKESSETCATSSTTTTTTTTAKTSPPIPTLTRSSAKQSGKLSSSSNFSRQSPGRSSERQRSMSPTKKSLVSSSKSKNEGQSKASNQPRIKENLKDSDDLRPKTGGSKLTTQEKIRSSNLKLTQLEDEIPIHTRLKASRKGWERVSGKSNLPSDNESIGTIESEFSDKNNGRQVKGVKSKWSSSESINKAVRKPNRNSGKVEKSSDDEKGVVSVSMNGSGTDSEKGKSKRKSESRSGKKNRQKLQINDLSVNDESFGIFVASCQPTSAIASRTCLKVVSESSKPSQTKKETRIGKLEETEKQNQKVKSEGRKKSGIRKSEPVPATSIGKEEEEEEVVVVVTEDNTEVINKSNNDQEKVAKTKRTERMSRIPKVKHETKSTKKIEKGVVIEQEMSIEEKEMMTKAETVEQDEEKKKGVEDLNQIQDRSYDIKKKSKKWRNISEMSTEELANISEDFNVVSEKLSESEIWEIAAEQFLKSDETVQSSSLISVDSLEENAAQKFVTKKSHQGGDDFIVLHVTDPSKLVENDADMKLSMSEPCFTYSGKIQKIKENVGGGKKIDIIVFTAFPGDIQRKLIHRKRKKVRRLTKRMSIPQSSPIREKTFLTDDLPKAKRRRFVGPEEEEKKSLRLSVDDLKEYFFEASPKEEFDERKRRFIEDLKKQREKIRKWQLTADTHIRFMEHFEKSIEDDLKELKDLSNGKKTKRKFGLREFIKEKFAKKTVEKSFCREVPKELSKSKNKKFEYFEISLEEVKSNDEKENRSPSPQKTVEGEMNSARGEFLSRENKPSSRKKREGETAKSRNRENKKTKPETDKETRDSDTAKKFECFEITNDFSKTTKRMNNADKNDSEQVLEECHEAEVNGRTSVEGNVESSPRIRSPTNETNSDTEESCGEKSVREIQEVVERKDGMRRGKMSKEGKKRQEVSWEVTIAGDLSMTDSVNCQNSSLENIEEVDENEEDEESFGTRGGRKDIEIEDFIISKPDTARLLSREGNCLDQLFPKPREIVETVTRTDSTTAVRLGYTTDSVYDLKSKEEKVKKVLDKSGNGKNPPSRILEKRRSKKDGKNSCQLPQILVASSEKKENSMMSLIELWKTKKEGCGEKEKSYKMKATLPSGKLTPLSNKNSFQIAVLPTVLKRQLSEMIYVRPLDRGDGNESYDPFKQAERQMLALLSWPSTVDIKSTKDLSPKLKSSSPPHKTNLETSPTSAFTKYPNKDEKSPKNGKTATTVTSKRNINETFEVNAETTKKNQRNEKPTYTAADDWEEIFEKHFDLNRNEMTEEMTRSMKSALDGLLKNSMKSNSSTGSSDKTDASSPRKSKSELENSVITEVLYTSTPKQSSKSEGRTRTRSKDSCGSNNNSAGLDSTPNTYRKNSDLSYGRITPPDDFTDSYGKGGKREEKPNRNSGISLSSLSFCSQISDTTLADEEVMRSNLEIIGKAAAAAASRTPRRKYARSQSVFDERNKMLFAKTYEPNSSSSDENDVDTLPKLVADKQQGKKSPSRNPHPKPVPSSHFYRSQSVVEDRCKGDGDHSDNGDHISSPDANRNRKAKMSGDSAYSSLNRRSPRGNVQANQQEDRLSSSGSETSLPKVNNNYGGDVKPKSLDFEGQGGLRKDQKVKMSKFCHECGSKYPVAVAKYCCECGVRRLII